MGDVYDLSLYIAISLLRLFADARDSGCVQVRHTSSVLKFFARGRFPTPDADMVNGTKQISVLIKSTRCLQTLGTKDITLALSK